LQPDGNNLERNSGCPPQRGKVSGDGVTVHRSEAAKSSAGTTRRLQYIAVCPVRPALGTACGGACN
jgi:hypothetical protein